jgi:hypothetical protein
METPAAILQTENVLMTPDALAATGLGPLWIPLSGRLRKLRVGAKLAGTAILILTQTRTLIMMLVTIMSMATIATLSTTTTVMTWGTATSVLGLGQRMIPPNGILQLQPVGVSHRIRIRSRSPTQLITSLETIA